jgi:hypothetical protein
MTMESENKRREKVCSYMYIYVHICVLGDDLWDSLLGLWRFHIFSDRFLDELEAQLCTFDSGLIFFSPLDGIFSFFSFSFFFIIGIKNRSFETAQSQSHCCLTFI